MTTKLIWPLLTALCLFTSQFVTRSESQTQPPDASAADPCQDAADLQRALGQTKASKSITNPTVTLDWAVPGSADQRKLFNSATYYVILKNVTDILYAYAIDVQETEDSGGDFEKLAGLLPAAAGGGGVAKALEPGKCNLKALVGRAQQSGQDLKVALDDMNPKKGKDGKYPSISLERSLTDWHNIVPDEYTAANGLYRKYTSSLCEVRRELENAPCKEESEKPNIASATEILNNYKPVKEAVARLNQKAHSDHLVLYNHTLERTKGYEVTARETFNGEATTAEPRKYTLDAGTPVLTLSGGFLLTQIQARSYSSRNVPPTPPATTATVLAVDGTSAIRPTLVGLLNYHSPFQLLESENFGMAISAGPVVDVSNGKSDTSRLGFFGGVSFHLWSRLFLTPGVHVGEFADFPPGFTAAGQPVPPGLGTPTPTKRYTTRFAFAITFQAKNLSNLLGGSTNKETSTDTSGKSKK